MGTSTQVGDEPNSGRIAIGPQGKSRPSKTDPSYIEIEPSALTTHTAIIAQSGSGKSYFLSRLLEEIVVKTDARCVVLDPNSDFHSFHLLREPPFKEWEVWDQGSWTRFGQKWDASEIGIFVATSKPDRLELPYRPFSLDWPVLSMDLIADDVDLRHRGQVYACHEYVRISAKLRSLLESGRVGLKEILADAEEALRREVMSNEPYSDSEELRRELQAAFDEGEMARAELGRRHDEAKHLDTSGLESVVRAEVAAETTSEIEAMLRASRLLKDEPAVSYYFTKAHSLSTEGLLGSFLARRLQRWDQGENPRVMIYDLPSFNKRSLQLIAVSSILATEWERARSLFQQALADSGTIRRPTFIVLEEAHNFLQGSSESQRAVIQQFRQIAAEGRKYGLFLVLVSQRPDKLDHFVVSECGNKALMRLDSANLAEQIGKQLGIPSQHVAECSKDSFGVGTVCFFGGWAGKDRLRAKVALRRTRESAPKIEDWHWIRSAATTRARAGRKAAPS